MKQGFLNLFNYTPETVVLYSRETNRPVLKIPPEAQSLYALQNPRVFYKPFADFTVVSPPTYNGQLNFMPARDISVIVDATVGPILRGHCKNVFSMDVSPNGCVRDKRTGRVLGTYNLISY